MSKHSVPHGDHPSRHPMSHHSDHSGAHVRGTAHHMAHAHNPKDGLTTAEGGKGIESGDSSGFSTRDGEGKSDMHISEHPSKLELPAMSHNRGDQE